MNLKEYRAQWEEKHKDADVLEIAKDGTPICAKYGYHPPFDVEAMLEILKLADHKSYFSAFREFRESWPASDDQKI